MDKQFLKFNLDKSGFSLIEPLITVSIIGLLVAVASIKNPTITKDPNKPDRRTVFWTTYGNNIPRTSPSNSIANRPA